MEGKSAREKFQERLVEAQVWRKRVRAGHITTAFSCASVATCGVSDKPTMEAGQGFCARCSRLKKPDLFLAKPT